MTLLRAAARTLLASQFVVTGYKAVRNPDPFVTAAEPVAERWLPVIQKYAPDQVSTYIPTETRTLVRVVGGLELVGGLALATGKGRRLGSVLLAISLVPATLAEYPFWTREAAEDKATDRALFLKNVSLLGGVVLAARDTEGKPGLAWLASTGTQSLVKDTTKAGRRVAKNTSQLTDAAVTGGAALVGVAVKQGRKARKNAKKQLKAAKATAAKQATAARAATVAAKKQAKKNTKQAKNDTRQGKVAAKLQSVAAKQDAKQSKVAARVQAIAAQQEKKAAQQQKKSAQREKKAAKQAKASAKQERLDAKLVVQVP